MTTGREAEATDAFLRAIDLEIEAIDLRSRRSSWDRPRM